MNPMVINMINAILSDQGNPLALLRGASERPNESHIQKGLRISNMSTSIDDYLLDQLSSIFLVIPIVSPNNGTTPPLVLHPGRASNIRIPHPERLLSGGCYSFL